MLDPLFKKIAKLYSRQCLKCETTCIESVLKSLNEKNPCPSCKKQIIIGKILLKPIMTYLKMDRKDLGDLTSDREAISLINAILRNIITHGRSMISIGIPLYVVFDISSKCNLNCIHCYSSIQKKELKTDDVYKVLDKLYEAGAGIIDFGGGEPLLRDDIFDILSYSKHIGLYTSISTNGILLDGNCIRHLKKINIDNICISLDGAKSETHDYIRNKSGAYKKAIIGIKNCVNAGINTQISTVFMKSNIHELINIYNLLISLDVDGWFVYDFIPAGHGKKLQNEMLNPIQRQQLLLKLQEFADSSNLSIKPYPYSITINSALDKDTFFYKKYGKLTELFQGCLAGRWVCHISSNGDIHPCYLLPYKLGNLKHDNFEDIWYDANNLILNELRDRSLLKGNCGICRYKDVCAGCRARALWSKGNYLESDDCWIKN